MKESIGFRSSGVIVVYTFGLILTTLLAFLMIYIEIGYSLLFFAFALLMLILIIFELRKPKNLIQYDENFLYLNYKNETVKINLNAIVHATPKRSRARHVTYTFGKVIVHTKHDEYRIGTVSECEQVCLNIMKLVNSKKFENDN